MESIRVTGPGLVTSTPVVASGLVFIPDAAPAPTPVPAPTPTPTPGILTPQLQNMTRGADGIYRSTNGILCYAQFRTPSPAKWVKYTGKRQTNVIPNVSGGGINQKLNLKTWRDWPEEKYPNSYIGIGPGNGAFKFTVEYKNSAGAVSAENVAWVTLPYQSDVWIQESYEFDYENGHAKISIGTMNFDGAFNPRGIVRTQFGIQCVVATDPAPVGLPASPYMNLKDLTFDWR